MSRRLDTDIMLPVRYLAVDGGKRFSEEVEHWLRALAPEALRR
jgi:hypothetical protein